MFLSQCFKSLCSQGKFGRVLSSGQADSSDNTTTMSNNVAPQVRKRSALANKIVDQKIVPAIRYVALKQGRRGKSLPPASTRVIDHIDLNHTGLYSQLE